MSVPDLINCRMGGTGDASVLGNKRETHGTDSQRGRRESCATGSASAKVRVELPMLPIGIPSSLQPSLMTHPGTGKASGTQAAPTDVANRRRETPPTADR